MFEARPFYGSRSIAGVTAVLYLDPMLSAGRELDELPRCGSLAATRGPRSAGRWGQRHEPPCAIPLSLATRRSERVRQDSTPQARVCRVYSFTAKAPPDYPAIHDSGPSQVLSFHWTASREDEHEMSICLLPTCLTLLPLIRKQRRQEQQAIYSYTARAGSDDLHEELQRHQ